MSITGDNEIIHPILGAIRYDNGVNDMVSSDGSAQEPMWVCRPDGWHKDFEIYLTGDEQEPKSISQAVDALSNRKRIEEEGIAIAGETVELGWIDLTSSPPTVAFPDNEEAYSIWKGSLDEDWNILNLKKESW